MSSHDPSSYAEPEKVVITHVALDLNVDFAKKVLAGSNTLDLDWKDPAAKTLALDTRSAGNRSGQVSFQHITPSQINVAMSLRIGCFHTRELLESFLSLPQAGALGVARSGPPRIDRRRRGLTRRGEGDEPEQRQLEDQCVVHRDLLYTSVFTYLSPESTIRVTTLAPVPRRCAS